MPAGSMYKVTKKDKQQDKKIRRLASQLKPEVKSATISNVANTVATQYAMAIQQFTLTGNANIDRGVGGAQRVGDRISVIGLELRGFCSQYTANVYFGTTRLIILQDNRYNGTALTGLEVLQAYNATDTSNGNFCSGYNPDQVNTRYEKGKAVRILYDKRIMCDGIFLDERDVAPATGISTAGSVYDTRHFKWIKKFKKPLLVNYKDDTDKTGQLYLMLFNGASTTAVNNNAVAFQVQVLFTDS